MFVLDPVLLTFVLLVEEHLVGEAEASVGKVTVKVIGAEVDPHVAAVHADWVQTRCIARERSERTAEHIFSYKAEHTNRNQIL